MSLPGINYSTPKLPSGAGDSAGSYVAVTPGSANLANGPCRAILCSADGALKLTDLLGNVVDNVPVQKGYNPLCAVAINSPGTGTAPTTVIALY